MDIADEIVQAAEAGGISNPKNLRHFWKKIKQEDGTSYSLFVKNPFTEEEICLTDMLRDALQDRTDPPQDYEPRNDVVTGDRLLMVDLADIHFGKLARKTETGFEYGNSIARTRVVEGTKGLLLESRPETIGRVLFVLGNDQLHIDNAQRRTTSGTPQDCDGSPFDAFRIAKDSLIDAIELCAEVADVDLVHCMSNHDWLLGWSLSQVIATHFANHPHVHASEYSMYETHRKYYRYGNNLIGLTHGDGAKEEKLYSLMVDEARPHIAECRSLYWILHHLHHKIAKKRGGNKPELREKDHIGMTAIYKRTDPVEAGQRVHVEHVRSPSAPDGWHDRNGYVNRQAVECFTFDPNTGMKARFTEWF